MANGGIIDAGRPVAMLDMGRAVPDVLSNWATFPRSSGVCQPMPRCCCKGPWYIAPGETQLFRMRWQLWIDSVPGYQLTGITEADLYDMNAVPPVPADPDMIRLATGRPDEWTDPDNSDAADQFSVIPPHFTRTLVSVGMNAPLNRQFKLSLAVTAKDCSGETITMRDCVVIVIAEC